MTPILLLVAVLTGCSSGPAAEGTIPPTEDLCVTRGDFRSIMLLTGELDAVSGEPLTVPRTPSWRVQIQRIEEDGALVKAGDPVVEFDTTAIIGDLQQKELAAQAALNALSQKKADVEIEKVDKAMEVERARIAMEKAELDASVPEEIRPRREHQEAQLALEKARVTFDKAVEDRKTHRVASRSELDNLELELDKARREVRTAQEAIDRMILHAPTDGIFVVNESREENRKWQVGDTVWVGIEVAEIPDLSAMLIRAGLSDVDDGKITPGMPATCTLDIAPDLQIPGTIREIGAVAQEELWWSSCRFFKVVVDLDRSDPELMRPGMSVKIEVETARKKDVLMVPRAALSFARETPRLLMADGTEREVRLGMCNAQECIAEGVEEGELLRAAS